MGNDVIFQRHNAFESWPGGKDDLVVAANLLNHSYFNNHQLGAMMRNIIQAVKNPGWVALIDNRQTEQSTIIRVEQPDIIVESRIGKGSEVEDLFLEIAVKSYD